MSDETRPPEAPCPRWSEEQPHAAHVFEQPFEHGPARCPGFERVIPPIAFLDIETVTLDPGEDVIWEIALVHRVGSLEQVFQWQLRPNMAKATPEALAVGRFDERYQLDSLDGDAAEALGWMWDPADLPTGATMTYDDVAASLSVLLDGAVLVGSGPWFDAERLALFLRRHGGLEPRWHHRLVDVKAEAAGWLKGLLRAGWYGAGALDAHRHAEVVDAARLPYDPEKLWRACGVEPSAPAERHTALGDARSAMRLYDAITGGAS